ncbi:MAG: hypothetical protein QOE58_3518 [Actinomycetota bacterium]|nr:hypothetical protein [Actinomycetota bacterium]
MQHITNGQWRAVAFLAAGALGIGLGVVSFLTEGVLADKAFFGSFFILVGMLAVTKTGKVDLPWWRNDKGRAAICRRDEASLIEE